MIDEFRLVLRNRLYKDLLNVFEEKYGDISEVCVDVYEFIEETNLMKIGIPIFIAHGSETSLEDIINEIQKINKMTLLGLETEYYFISLPIVSNDKFITNFTYNIRERREQYGNERKKLRASRNSGKIHKNT